MLPARISLLTRLRAIIIFFDDIAAAAMPFIRRAAARYFYAFSLIDFAMPPRRNAATILPAMRLFSRCRRFSYAAPFLMLMLMPRFHAFAAAAAFRFFASMPLAPLRVAASAAPGTYAARCA